MATHSRILAWRIPWTKEPGGLQSTGSQRVGHDWVTLLMGIWASLVAQRLKRLPPMQETRVWSLDREDPLEKEMATHSSILAWRIPWTEEPGGLQSTGSQRVGHDWVTLLTYLPFDPEIPLLGIHPEKTIIQKNMYTPVFTAALFTTAGHGSILNVQRSNMTWRNWEHWDHLSWYWVSQLFSY